MKKVIFLASLFASSLALATSTTYEVTGMHCGSCAKAIKAKVCAIEGLEKCDVTLGQIQITPKAGVKIDQAKIEAEMNKAGDYKIIKSESK